MSNLVSTAWLAANLQNPQIVICDATLYLPNEGKDARTEFQVRHIPGARFFDINEIADPETSLPHMVPSPSRFARLVGALGIANTSHVIFYDQNGTGFAARGWWMMGLFGHDHASLLDGGLIKWVAEGRQVESGIPLEPDAKVFLPAFRADRLRGVGDMLDNLNSGRSIVLDARASARFRAEVPETRPGLSAGHIPGSRNLPYSRLITADRTFLPPDRLREEFAAVGVDGRSPVITSCGSGVSATVLALAMKEAGLPQPAVYDGSWTEWGGRPDTPVETQ